MPRLFEKSSCRGSYLLFAVLGILALVFLAIWRFKARAGAAAVDPAELVRAVREGENWIHQFDSLLIRVEAKWTRTPEGIAARRKELKERSPDIDPDPNRFWGLKPIYTETLEFAIQQGAASRQRLRFLENTPGKSYVLTIWDGKERLFNEKHFTHKQEGYLIDNKAEKIAWGLFAGMSWPRAQPHSFWWDSVDVEGNLKWWGRAEDFAFKGYANYRGVECYVLECKPPALTGRVKRWYVGKKDRLLYGNLTLSGGKITKQHWTLDYKQVAPGWWYPMTQGYELYDLKRWPWPKAVLNSRRDLNVTEVRVNEKLPDELFQMGFKEGVKVLDRRFGGTVSYLYKANRTEQEWQEIRERARNRSEQNARRKQFKDRLLQ